MRNLEELYKNNYEIVYKYLLAISHNESISEELTQETFYKAIKNIHKFKENSKISTWLCTIAKNLWIDELKRKNKTKILEENNVVITLDDKLLEDENKIELFKKIQKLDVEMRDVMYLRISGELNFKEIADIMNKTETWARVTFYRGKEKLKEEKENGNKSNLCNN